jgi:hypothetical protein
MKCHASGKLNTGKSEASEKLDLVSVHVAQAKCHGEIDAYGLAGGLNFAARCECQRHTLQVQP